MLLPEMSHWFWIWVVWERVKYGLMDIGRYWTAYAPNGYCDGCNYAGMYWPPKCQSGYGQPTQRWYHVQQSWLRPTKNLLVVFEELGGDATKISLVKRSVSGVCVDVSEGHPMIRNCHIDSYGQPEEHRRPKVHLQCLLSNSQASALRWELVAIFSREPATHRTLTLSWRSQITVWNMSREHWAPLGLKELPKEEYAIQRPKPQSKMILDTLQKVLDEKDATSMEKARLLSKMTSEVTRRSGLMEEVEFLMDNCHKYTEAHLNGNKIKKASDEEGNVWVWLKKEYRIFLVLFCLHCFTLSLVWSVWAVDELSCLLWSLLWSVCCG